MSQPKEHLIIVNPDQVQQRGSWYWGTGRLPSGTKINFSGISQQHLTEQTETFCLSGDLQWKKIAPATNKGEFNLQKYYGYQGIYYQCQASNLRIIHTNRAASVLDYLHIFRQKMLLQMRTLPHWLRVNADSLLLGEFDSSEKSLRQGLTNLGIIHIFSISGLHVYLLIAWLMKFTSFLRIPVEKVEWFLLITLPFLAVIAGSGVGIWRACILQMLIIVGKKLHWSLTSLDYFALTLIIHTLFDPLLLFTLAGQLSYLLSFGLIMVNTNSLLVQSGLINLLSVPILVYHNFSFSWLTFIANICLTPLFESAIIPLTIFSVILSKVHFAIQFLEIVFDLIYVPIEKLANASWTQLTIGHINTMITIVLVISTLILLNKVNYKHLFFIIINYMLIMCFNYFPLVGNVTFIDIGQGDSILWTTPFHQHTYLIDTGGKLRFGKKVKNPSNRVEQITIPYLRYQGINKIDGVFLSHQDADHIGDLAVLLANFPVKNIYFADGMQNNRAVRRQLSPFAHKITFHRLTINDQLILNKTDNIKVVWPDHLSNGSNEDSMSLLITINGFKWLFTGDLNRANELKLFKKSQHIDFLKAGHHGSKTASDPKFLKQIKPKLVIISAGRHNRYGHPHPETMRTLNKLKIDSVSTAKHGMITWKYNIWHNSWWQVFSRKSLNEN
ncbi:DNA internalization-related competence protein ComEC/Rec2 [Bombilactobacillus thymidiniphilus]|uniref:DNA internalization-related competence protein ComEC/Rec2 n=1 Tax=Bombilactobacillus thymidiniphilus TaxID=2923363 RepID=A0ABY4PDR0_9LACO|nr:DNA internalization-related competence protein ComEC/Rec2 [Bombilactobacillus thymidiniphilus]UQS83755.1 DNA internalization-related competence protein ComEC/Rec2 [Bombilactobacillus thymidiniphilus]